MIQFFKTVSEAEIKTTYLNLTDDRQVTYGDDFPVDKTKLCIIDEEGNEFIASKRGNNQIWGSISKWFKTKDIQPGTEIKISYDKLEMKNDNPVIHIEINSLPGKMENTKTDDNTDIKDRFYAFLIKQQKLESTVKQYLNWIDKIQIWFIENGVCESNYIIWKRPDLNDEINEKLNSEFKEIWQLINKEQKNWYSSPWNQWINFNNSKIPNIKPKTFNITNFKDKILEAGLFFTEQIIVRFVSSLLTKPFVILTGLSGSGKTKLAQAFTKWICDDFDNQTCMISVGADWTNRDPLLGYCNALESGKYIMPENGALKLILEASKNENQTKPYFLILDEMNLSHVERYFADFLSTMESSEAIALHPDTTGWNDEIPSKIKLPDNLFIIGTVNIDETTYMFSPKVLDRANVIEFRISETEIENYLNSNTILDLSILKAGGADVAASFVEIGKDKTLKSNSTSGLQQVLIEFFRELKKVGAEFGYRSVSEILRFAVIVNKVEPSYAIAEIIDAAIMQKLLPKVHGSRRKLEPVLKVLGSRCLIEKDKIETYLNSKTELVLADIAIYPLSFEKISRMYKGLIDNGFTSYAEA